MLGNCRVASQLVASRVVLSSVELISSLLEDKYAYVDQFKKIVLPEGLNLNSTGWPKWTVGVYELRHCVPVTLLHDC
jgi:hypothetical protein